jgi:hypothetical protein
MIIGVEIQNLAPRAGFMQVRKGEEWFNLQFSAKKK